MSNQTDLTRGDVRRQLIRYSVPVIATTVLQTVYSLIDLMVVSHLLGSAGASGVSNSSQIVLLLTNVAVGLANGGNILVGQYFGSGDKEEREKVTGCFITLFVLVGLLIAAASVACSGAMIRALKAPAFDEALAYLRTASVGLVFVYIYNCLASILRAVGNSKQPLRIIVVTCVVNVILDLLFVPVLKLGAMGAALATVLGQGVAFGWALVFLYRRRTDFGFDFKPARFIPHADVLGTLLRLGIPMAAQGALISVSMLYVCSMLNDFGVAASAANGIQLKLANITRIVTTAMCTAASAMIAQCVGAGKQERVKSVFWWDLIISMAAALAFGVVLLLLPRQIFGLFNTEEAVLAYASVYAVFGLFDCIGNAMRSPCNALVNGTGAALLGLTASIIDGVLCRIGFSILFGNVLGMGVAGYWLGSTLAGYVSVVILAPFFLTGAWKQKKRL